MTDVSKFYDLIAFPGYYTIDDLLGYGTPIENRYLRAIEENLKPSMTVLDAGCGTGLTTNLFALRNPSLKITGVDFSNSVAWAKDFALRNNITNVEFLKHDLTAHTFDQQYDVVICQGVLHHIPDWPLALNNLINAVAPNGRLLLGLYHPFGKAVKKLFRINYGSDVLYLDQEKNPFELSFTYQQVADMVPGFKIVSAIPSVLNNVAIPSFFNYRNGGLVIYTLERTHI